MPVSPGRRRHRRSSWHGDAVPGYYAVPWRGRWETELGGVLTSQAIHLLDMLTYIAGPVDAAFCRAVTRVNDIEVEDTVAASLRMADGSLATVNATLGSPEELSRHRFHFERFVAESSTDPYNSAAPPWRITPDNDAAASDIERVLATVPERRDSWGASSNGSPTRSTPGPTLRSRSAMLVRRSRCSPRSMYRLDRASTSRFPRRRPPQLPRMAAVSIEQGGGLWTYVAEARKRPHIHPVPPPSGAELTRDAPPDHPWHHALWFTIKYVNEENFWEEQPPYGVLRHAGAPTVDGDSISGDSSGSVPTARRSPSSNSER